MNPELASGTHQSIDAIFIWAFPYQVGLSAISFAKKSKRMPLLSLTQQTKKPIVKFLGLQIYKKY